MPVVNGGYVESSWRETRECFTHVLTFPDIFAFFSDPEAHARTLVDAEIDADEARLLVEVEFALLITGINVKLVNKSPHSHMLRASIAVAEVEEDEEELEGN